MIRAIFIFFFLGLLISNAQEINQTNSKGERVGLWMKYYESGRIRYEGRFDHGKEVGEFKFYEDSKDAVHPSAIKKYKPNSTLTEVQFYDAKGILKTEGFFEGKKRVGKWTYYHKGSSEIMIIEHYKDNQLDGNRLLFYRNGIKTVNANYKSGLLHGISKSYSSEGVLIEQVVYKHNKREGLAIFYHVNGDMKAKGFYENDQKIGEWEVYEDGQLREVVPAAQLSLIEE